MRKVIHCISNDRYFRIWMLVSILSCLASFCFAIPQKIAVSGALFDEDNNPIDGEFQMLVSFHDQPSTESAIGSTKTTIVVENGFFGVAVDVPRQLATLERVWFLVSIDIDGDGFDPEDSFGEFHEIVSVPFALTGKPAEFFETSGGHKTSFSGAGSSNFIPNTLVVVPFNTPAGGVRFNRLALRAVFSDTSSYGIYDESGKLVVTTDTRPPDVLGDPFVFLIEGRLRPSSIYFAAYTSTAIRTPSTRISLAPTLPTVGRIVGAGIDGRLPDSIALDQIQPLEREPTLSFGLFYVDEESPSILRKGRGDKTSFEDLAPEIQKMIRDLKLK